MRKIRSTEAVVKQILISNPSTRNSDTILYAAVCEKINPIACNLSFSTVMAKREEFGFPKYDTVGRARRKLQEEFEELRASEEVTNERYENWKAVRDYATE